MKPSYIMSLIVGAVSGVVIALAILLFVGSLGAVSSLNPAIETGSVDPVFSISASALWSMTLISGMVGGGVLSAATYGAARVIDPGAKSVHVGLIITIGAIVGAVVAISVVLLGAGVFGTISDGTVTVTVVQMVVLTLVSGLAAGASVTWLAYLLARPPLVAVDPELLAA